MLSLPSPSGLAFSVGEHAREYGAEDGRSRGSTTLLWVVNSYILFSQFIWKCWDRYFKSVPLLLQIFCTRGFPPVHIWIHPKWRNGCWLKQRENKLQEVIQSVRSQLTTQGPPTNFSKIKLCLPGMYCFGSSPWISRKDSQSPKQTA